MRESRGTQFAPPRWARAAAIIAVVAAYLGIVSAAQAVPVYVFNPQLSLTGDCSSSSKTPVDEVPDPGCPEPANQPSAPFNNPTITTDAYGDLYVSAVTSEEWRIDIFSPKGFLVTEFKISEPGSTGPRSMAVDSEGNLYVFEENASEENMVRRFPPSVYKPEEEEIEYGKPPVVVVSTKTKPIVFLGGSTLAVDSKDRLYIDGSKVVSTFKSAKEGNELIDPEAIGPLERSKSIAVDSKHEKIYISEKNAINSKSFIRIFEWEAPYEELGQITGTTTPQGEFLTTESFIRLAVDDPTGHVFVGDLSAAKKVYEFEEDGTYLATIEHSFNDTTSGAIAIDDGPSSPNPGYLFVPSVPFGTGHVYAFEPKIEEDPSVEARPAEDVTETDATLPARINPGGLPTTYSLEYIGQQQFEEDGESFANATLGGEGALPASGEDLDVSASAQGLSPGTTYRFRVVAENKLGTTEDVRVFTTFKPVPPVPPCPNDALRLGVLSGLPDCRAYELVTPPDTNGHPPRGGTFGAYFATMRAAPDGGRVSFMIDGGTLPGEEGVGSFNGDPYLATRGTDGWTSEIAGPSGEETGNLTPGSFSPDQTYSVWKGDGEATFLRYPDGHSELIGQGSLGSDPTVNARLLTENAGHVVFQGDIQLEEAAPPSGTTAIYDRAAEGPTHVISLLPGNVTPVAKEDAKYLGASEEGEGIAFSIGGSIYLRLHNEETFKVAGPGTTFAGVGDEGKRVFYTEGGDLFAFDAAAEEPIAFSTSGDVTPVNVASGGTGAYFVSPSVLTSEPNPNGEEAKAGKENLYLSEEGAISFVGTVTERDVEGENPGGTGRIGGLGLWQEALESSAPAKDPSRTTPSGATLLFESRADLTGFGSEGFAQVYRYDATDGRLDCLSCSPTETPPSSDASLQSIAREQFSPEPAGSFLKIANQSPDGKRAFFQTAEPLVLGDSDRELDVYEWEEEGIGSCEIEGGCIYLISGSHSASPDYLYGMSASGNDVFFRTADLLLPRDVESTLSIYDARVDGGFAEPPPPKPCEEGETCKPLPEPPPALSTAAKAGPEPPPPTKKNCPKGKHKAKRHGKTVCVKNHHKKHHHRQATGRKGGAK